MANNQEWLRQLAAANKRGVALRVPRHAPFVQAISLPGDFTGATLIGQVRLYPDAPGAALVALTVAGPVLALGRSKFTLTLTEAQIEALPAAAVGEAEVTLVYDLLLTTAAAAKELLMGEEFIVIGGATNV